MKDTLRKHAPRGMLPLFCCAPLLYLFVCQSPVCADTLVQKQGEATAVLTAPNISKGQVHLRLSGDIQVELTVVSKTAVKVKAGKRIFSGDFWAVTEITLGQVSKLADGKTRWQERYRVEPLRPGKHSLQIAPLEYQKQSGAWRKVQWEAVPVNVTTIVKEASKKSLKPISRIEELPRAKKEHYLHIILIAAGVIFLLLVTVIMWRLRRRQFPPPSAPPEEIALRELEQLQTSLPANVTESADFHTRLGNILRVFLEQRFLIQARRQTSLEFYEALSQADHLTSEQLDSFKEFIGRCELPKFAPLEPSPEECLKTLELARSFVASVRESRE